MDWHAFLSEQGASLDAAQHATFPKADQQFDALAQGAVVVPLSHFGLIRLHGEETVAFLQGQLSSDVKKLASPGWQYSSYSTPKGRMLASFLLLRNESEVWLQMPSPMVPAIQKRLTMFILRSKVRAEDASQSHAIIGLAGPKAQDVATKLGIALPTQIGAALAIAGGWVLCLHGDRYQFVLENTAAQALWTGLTSAGAVAADAAIWTLGDIRAGTPWVLPNTQEEFVPQMANMELIGAVSFQKGCYPGQEIVARTQYLGKLKRRAFHVLSDIALQAKDAVFSAEMNGQASGMVAMSAPRADGKWEALVVAQISSVEHGLHLQSAEGPVLTVLPLPYALEDITA